MRKRMVSCLLFCLLVLGLALPVSAAAPLVIDKARLMDSAQVALLEAKAQEIRREYDMDVVLLTVDSLEGKSTQDYADDYFDYQGYGVGEDGDGLIFLLSMEERDWYISTCGDTIYALTDYGIQQLGETAVWYFSEGDFYGGFDAFLSLLPEYLAAYKNGTPIDGYADYSGSYYHGDREEVVYYEEDASPNLLISLGLGILVAGIVVVVMRSSLNTKRQQHGASGYLNSGSFRLRTHQDMFLYSNISKTRRQQNSGSRSGGGSSVHRSSSGRRHGGGGGKF